MKKILFVSFILGFQNVVAQDNFIMVGSGGGFAGTATVYKICLDGKVLKGKGLGDIVYREQSKVGRSVAKKFFKEVKLQVGAMKDFNHPGNLYYFISLSEKGKVSNITWGDAEHTAPKEIEKLYQDMTSTLTTLNFVQVKAK